MENWVDDKKSRRFHWVVASVLILTLTVDWAADKQCHHFHWVAASVLVLMADLADAESLRFR